MDLAYLEITRQYKMLDKTIKYIESQKHAIRQFYLDKKPKSIVFIGSGSSYFVSQSAEIIARNFGFYSFSISSGDVMVNFNAYRASFEGSMVVAISRSGNTTEILKTITEMQKVCGIPVVVITCVEDSKLGKISDLCLNIPWAFDESVCQTGTVTNLYAAVSLLLAGFADCGKTFEELEMMTAVGDKFIEDNESAFKNIAEIDWNKVVVLADGEISGLACEGALAFKEISRNDSNYYHVLDVRHGPMVMIDKNTLVMADLKPENREYQLNLIGDLAKRGPTIVVCTDESYDTIENVALHIKHKNVGNIAEGLPFINIAQIIAYYKAILKGLDPGNPDGLDAWIKL